MFEVKTRRGNSKTGIAKKISLIACDVEGCITPAKRTGMNIEGMGLVQQYCAEVNKRHEDKSRESIPPIILVTGRATGYVEAILQNINALGPAFVFPSVIENGALFWDHNKKKVCHYHTIVDAKRKEISEVDKFVKELTTKRECKGVAIKEPGKEICISLNPVQLSIEDLYDLVLEVFKKRQLDEIVNITHSSTAVDITPKGINKFSGLKELLLHEGVDPAKVLGVGDSEGDVDWLNSIGIRTAPHNATEDLRSKVKGLHIADFPDSLGLAQILQSFILNKVK
jgi:HAD superfamily hydrolase (TIGR01484 family)